MHRTVDLCSPSTRSGHNSPTAFYVRVGNSTKALHGNDMLEYQANHWAADG